MCGGGGGGGDVRVHGNGVAMFEKQIRSDAAVCC